MNTYRNDKKRLSVILAIVYNGYKLPPILIFKGGKRLKLESKLE